MRLRTVILIPFVSIGFTACYSSRDDSAARERRTPAYEAGRAAREIAKESEKAAKAAGRELKRGASEAHEGWKDQSREDRAKGKP